MNLSTLPAGTRVTFICEKYSQARSYAKAWASFQPNLPTVFISLNHIRGADTVIPRDIKYGALPVFRDPVFKRLSQLTRVYDLNPVAADSLPPYAGRDQWLLPSCASPQDAILNADVIVYACDDDVRGVGMFRRFLQTHVGFDYDHKPFPAPLVSCLDEETLHAAFLNCSHTQSPEFRRKIHHSETKQFFDYNWALNALPLLGDALRTVSVASADPFVSKFELLLLYAIRQQGHMIDSDAIVMMSRWKGSGKFSGEQYYNGLASPTSRDTVLTRLKEKALIEPKLEPELPPVARTPWGISALGEAFLDQVHPDCYDPDIGFRIQHWGETWPASRPKMERYFRTYFGKQKRFARRVISA